MVEAKKKAKVRPDSRAVREDLVRELRHLRAAVREVGESFILRREGEIETIIGILDTIPAAPLRTEAPDWLHGIRELKLKPAKGRLKDLKELNALIEELADRAMTIQDGKKTRSTARKAR